MSEPTTTTIGQMTAAPGSAAESGDLLEIERSGASYRVAASWLVTLARAGLTLAWSAITGKPTTLSGYGITDATPSAALAAHEADTTDVHGIADTSALVLTSDSRLSDARAPTSHTHTASEVSDSTAAGQALLTAASASAQRSALGLGTAATQASTAFAAASHGHAIADVTGLQAALDGKLAAIAAQTLTDGASIAWNVASGVAATVTLGGARALANPTNIAAGHSYVLIVKQDATGGRTLSFGTAYKWPGGTAPTITATANAVDILTFISDGTSMYGVAAQAFA